MYVFMQLSPPELKDTPEAPQQAQEDLSKMGPMTRDEKLMLGTMGGAVVLWVLGDVVGISSVVTAMLGLSWLLLTGVLQWKDCLTYTPAWDTLFWFAVLVGMSGQLNNAGVVKVRLYDSLKRHHEYQELPVVNCLTSMQGLLEMVGGTHNFAFGLRTTEVHHFANCARAAESLQVLLRWQMASFWQKRWHVSMPA